MRKSTTDRMNDDGCLGAHSPAPVYSVDWSSSRTALTPSRQPDVCSTRSIAILPTASVSQGNMLDARDRRPHSCAKESIIGIPEPSAHFPSHVHLDQRELFEILRADLVEIGG
jgi:hypothetical protein